MIPRAPPPELSGVTSGQPFQLSDAPRLLRLLAGTVSHDTKERQTAEAQVEQYKHHPGWRACLLHLALTATHHHDTGAVVSDELRTMLVILFKNGCDVLFRRTFGPNTINRDADEKDAIKSMLQQFLLAEVEISQNQGQTLSLHAQVNSVMSERCAGLLAVAIGMVAKNEWPQNWSTLFPTLLQGLQATQPRTVSRSLYTLHQIMKAMQATRLPIAKAKFQTATQTIITCVRTKWMTLQEQNINTIASIVQSGNAAAFTPELNSSLVSSCKLSLLFLKCLHRLILYGVSDLGTSIETQTLFPFFLDQLQKLVQLLPKLSQPSSLSNPHPVQFPFLEYLFSLALLMLRTVHQALDNHTWQFSNYFVPFVQFSLHILQHNASTTSSAAFISPETNTDLGSFPLTTVLEPLCVECMQYLQSVIRLYSRPPTFVQALIVNVKDMAAAAGSAQIEPTRQQIYRTMDELFTPSMLEQLLTLLLQHYLVLKYSDMDAWINDSETFYNEERSGCNTGDDGSGDDNTLLVMNARGGDSSSQPHEYTLRMVAETLIKGILEKYGDAVAPLILNMFMQLLQSSPPGTAPSTTSNTTNLLILKESIYSALGYCYLFIPKLLASQPHNITFLTFFNQVLLKELSNPSIIIRRRVIWLVGEWVNEVDDSSRLIIYQGVITLLQEQDLLIRMTAIDTLFHLLDNASFSCEGAGGELEDEFDVLDLTTDSDRPVSSGYEALLNQFSQHLSQVLTLLFQILQQQAEELPTKQHILFVISKIIGSMKSRVMTSPGCLEILLQYLPNIWSGCVNNNQTLLRTNILDVIQKLVTALSWKSQAIHTTIIIPMLSYIFDPKHTGGETNVLIDQGLELWKITIQNCVTYTPQLGELFRALMIYMSTHSNYLQVCVEIIESYIHLGREEFMNIYANLISELFASLLSKSNIIRPEVVSSHGTSCLLPSNGGDVDFAVTDDAIVVLMPVLEAITQIYPSQVPQLFQRTFQTMISSIIDTARYQAMSEQEQKVSQLHIPCDQVLAGYFTVIGRMCFQNIEGSLQLFQHLSGTNPGQFPIQLNELLSLILSVWERKLNSIALVYKKKVCVLGMINAVLASNDSTILQLHLKHVMSCVRRVEIELPVSAYEQPDWSLALTVPVDQRLERHRIQLMLKDDPSNRVGCREYLLEKLEQLSKVIGTNNLQQLITNTCEPHVWNEISSGNFATS